MRLPALIVICAANLPALESWGLPDMRQRDKQEHFVGGVAVGALAVVGANLAMLDAKPWKKAMVGLLASAVVGVAKECYDARHPRTHDADPKDAIATVAGGALGSLSVSFTLRF